jgi:hypothetical protein
MFTKINKSRIGSKRATRICVPFYKNAKNGPAPFCPRDRFPVRRTRSFRSFGSEGPANTDKIAIAAFRVDFPQHL